MATDRTARLSASPPLFESRFLDFFSRIHPVGPGADLRPGDRRADRARRPRRPRARWRSSDCSRPACSSGRSPSIGCTAGLPLGPRPPDRPPPALHHPRRPPRPPERQDAAGHAPRARASRWPLLFFGLFWLIFGTPTAYPLFAGFLAGYLIYDYTHYYLHHFVPKSARGKQLREQHMRHHFQDHRFGYGVSSPLWDAVFRTLPRTRRSPLTVTLLNTVCFDSLCNSQ